jgi:hypothetical protein
MDDEQIQTTGRMPITSEEIRAGHRARILAEVRAIPGEAEVRIRASMLVGELTAAFLCALRRRMEGRDEVARLRIEEDVRSDPGQALIAGIAAIGLSSLPLGRKETRTAVVHELMARAAGCAGTALLYFPREVRMMRVVERVLDLGKDAERTTARPDALARMTAAFDRTVAEVVALRGIAEGSGGQ